MMQPLPESVGIIFIEAGNLIKVGTFAEGRFYRDRLSTR